MDWHTLAWFFSAKSSRLHRDSCRANMVIRLLRVQANKSTTRSRDKARALNRYNIKGVSMVLRSNLLCYSRLVFPGNAHLVNGRYWPQADLRFRRLPLI